MSTALAVRDFQFDVTEDIVSVAEAVIRLKLAQIRKRRRLTMAALAAKAAVAPATILNIERGRKPRFSTIDKLAEALNMDPEDIDWPGNPLGLDAP